MNEREEGMGGKNKRGTNERKARVVGNKGQNEKERERKKERKKEKKKKETANSQAICVVFESPCIPNEKMTYRPSSISKKGKQK